MLPTFKQERFHFDITDAIPDHIDDYPDSANLERGLHHIEGLVPEDGDFIWLAINLESSEVARTMLAAAIHRQRSEGTSPLGIALVGPGFNGAYSAGDNILSPN